MRKLALVALLTTCVLPAACTWVDTTPSGNRVRVAYDGNVAGCRDAGTVNVSVTNKVAFYQRPDLKVRDELESLARNQAAEIPADTIRPNGEPKDGSQQFEAFVCGRMQARQTPTSERAPLGEAETHPLKDH
jgi:hypothetical protein